jgi:hypothetical protein
MNKKEKIVDFKNNKNLPITFNLLTQVPLTKQKRRNLFFAVDAYQGLTLAEPFTKPYSKIINWESLNEK